MSSTVASAGFSTANPHALATILEASQTKSIIASRDIFDVSGTKLWAREHPVSQALQRKLLDRHLRQPLESCLVVEDGVTGHALVQAVESLLAHETPLSALLRPCADKVVHAAAHVRLHSVAQLLLSASQASRPESFDHAVQAMALNGALMISHGGDTRDVHTAMQCGLLHDLGEMYIGPRYGEADADRDLDVESYRHLVVHPHVGKLLVEQLTDYPAEVARAIGEHHERLDGSGYPRCLQRDQVSPLGRQLAVTEGVLGALRGSRAHLARASVALRVVPFEYDLDWVGRISDAVRGQPALQPRLAVDQIQARLVRLDAAIQAAHNSASALMLAAETPSFKDALVLAQHLLDRLRAGWNASGLWIQERVVSDDSAEVEAIEDELLVRMCAIQRAVRLRAGELPEEDALRMNLLCEVLGNDLS